MVTETIVKAVIEVAACAAVKSNPFHVFLTETQFKSIFPKAPQGLFHAIVEQLPLAKCETKAQQAMFFAQCGHETAGFSVFSENLNYSAERLLKVFPKYFNKNNVSAYARDKAKIASRVYANRMGNGDEKSGEGWKYRGRGVIQVTGKDNYRSFATWCKNLAIIQNPDLVLSSLGLIVSTGVWYWNERKLGQYNSVETVTRLINGGLNGLEERKALYNKLMSL